MDVTPLIDFTQLAALVRGYRETEKLTLREAAEQSGVSPSTLSRVERGQARHDLDTVRALVAWVKVPIEKVLSGQPPSKPSKASQSKASTKPQTLATMEVHFRADPALPPKAAEALITIMRVAYLQLAQKKQEK